MLTEPLVTASTFEDTETTQVMYCSESLTEMSSRSVLKTLRGREQGQRDPCRTPGRKVIEPQVLQREA